jgi:ATPase subunit of ABC transporter with duplicated ATPase domains
VKLTDILDAEDIQAFLDGFEAQRKTQTERRNRAYAEISEASNNLKIIEGKIQRLRKALPRKASAKNAVSTERQTELLQTERSPSGRAKHGQTEKVVIDFLKERNGSGATVKEMALKTGIKYPTIHRQVNVLRERGQARKDRFFHWHLIIPT